MTPICVLSFLFLSYLLQLVSAVKCPSSFSCGTISNIQFPFTVAERPDCGVLSISGCNHSDSAANKSVLLETEGQSLDVLGFYHSIIAVRDNNLHKYLKSQSCDAFNNNITLPPPSPLYTSEIKDNITLFRCNKTFDINPPKAFQNYPYCNDYNIFYYCPNNGSCPAVDSSSLAACSTIQLPIRDLADTNLPFAFLTPEFFIEVHLSPDCAECHRQEGGQCQLDISGNFYCSKGDRNSSKLTKGLGLGLGFGGLLGFIVVGSMVKFYSLKWKKENPTNQMIESFLKKHGSLQTRRYTFSEIKKVTKSFENKLGQGGYGSVYKGQLNDGQFVAVKVLNEFKGTGEEFINELASISNTSHVNIVMLLGFCFEGSKRALVYEFMPNGSLEKFIYQENNLMVDHQLNCKTLYNIAIGIARGLEYLHRGCNTRILHFDIKPHNILLNGDFSPKISDFGLAKIFPKKESIVSLTGARGTIGYIAPEVISRNFGLVSHKSDVYSYGMMVLEIVGGRKNINIEVDCSSEIYFPHWIYKRLELNQEILLRCIKNETDDEIVRKMTLVSLWCIQTNPSNRPTMSKVVEMLEGCLESLQVPPKPYLSSPPISPTYCANTCNLE